MSYIPPSLRSRDSSKIAPEPAATQIEDNKTSTAPYLPPIRPTKIHVKSKVVDTTSLVEFPSLSTVPSKKNTSDSTRTNYVSLAKAWAVKDADERQQKENEELQRLETERQTYIVTRRPRAHENYSHSSYGPSLADEPRMDYEEQIYYDEDIVPGTNSSNPLGIKRDDFMF
jgi:hypothetical protein